LEHARRLKKKKKKKKKKRRKEEEEEEWRITNSDTTTQIVTALTKLFRYAIIYRIETGLNRHCYAYL
jgi:hypothetical protein